MRTLVLCAVGFLLVSCGSGADVADQPETTTEQTIPGVAAVELLEPPETGAGRAPRFAWVPVEGAAEYVLVVVGPSGAPTWSWTGPDTEVWMGGYGRELPAGLSEPVVRPGSSWSVAAFDASGDVLALSESRPVSPGDGPTPSTSPSTTAGESAPPLSPPDTTAAPVAVLDPCVVVGPAFVEEIAGVSGTGDVVDVMAGDRLLGKSCSWPAGSLNPTLRVGIYTTSASSFVDRCDHCEELAEPGDRAWGGSGEVGPGVVVASLYVEAGGLTYTVDTTGVDVDPALLVELVASLLP